MRVRVKRWDHEVPPEFQEKLDKYNESSGPPEVFVRWNPEAVEQSVFGVKTYDPRWEIWVLLADNSHPRNRGTMKNIAEWVPGKGWAVKLISWCRRGENGEDVGFAPLDERLIEYLHFCDTYRHRRHYNETIERSGEDVERARRRELLDRAHAAHSYWRNLDNPTIGPEASGDWRGARAPWR